LSNGSALGCIDLVFFLPFQNAPGKEGSQGTLLRSGGPKNAELLLISSVFSCTRWAKPVSYKGVLYGRPG